MARKRKKPADSKQPDTHRAWVRLIDPEVRQRFLDSLAAQGTLIRACDAAGVSRSQAWQLRKDDPAFAEECEDAQARYVANLYAEAHRRAVEGTDKPVTFQGEITDTYKEYSDSLLLALLKRHDPEMTERAKVETSGTQTVKHVLDEVKLTRKERDALRVLAKAAKPEAPAMAARKRTGTPDA